MTERNVIERLRKEIERAGSMRRLAEQWGISLAYVSDCLNGRRAPGPAILEPMGLRKVVVVTYEAEPKGKRRAR